MYNVKFAKRTVDLFLTESIIENFKYEESLKKKIDLKINDKMSYSTNVKGGMTDWRAFVEDLEVIEIINSRIELINKLTIPKCYLIDCWGNRLKQSEEVTMHDHYEAIVSGVIYLTEGGPGTYFPEFDYTVEEKIGKIVFFSGRANHKVIKKEDDTLRYTIAFNFSEVKPWF